MKTKRPLSKFPRRFGFASQKTSNTLDLMPNDSHRYGHTPTRLVLVRHNSLVEAGDLSLTLRHGLVQIGDLTIALDDGLVEVGDLSLALRHGLVQIGDLSVPLSQL